MSTPYRADQVGSFLRPPELLEARRSGSTDLDRLQAIENRHIQRVLAQQKGLEFQIFTDGELRRRNFMSDFTDAVEGFDLGDAVGLAWDAKGGAATVTVSSVTGIVTSKLRQVRRLTGQELPFMKGHSPGPIKMTLPSSTQFPAISWKRGITDKVYATHSDLLWDIVPIMRGEMQALAGEGVAYLQIDAPRYSYNIDPKWREFIKTEMRMEPDAALDEAIRADNTVLEGARAAGAHERGVTLADAPLPGEQLQPLVRRGRLRSHCRELFNTMQVDRFLLEYDDARSGTFEPLRFIPKGKQVVLGLVSSKRPALESKDDLKRRIEEASRYIPMENLALSPQCGFASTMEGNLLTEDDQWAKLRLVVETAREVWGP